MQYVKVFDNHKKTIVGLVLNENNKINYDYFQVTFPDAVGLLEKNEDCLMSIPFDENKNFTWNWNDNVVYDLIYSDPRNDRLLTSTSSSSTTTLKDKIWAWMGVAGGLFSSSKSSDQYKKLT